jgi:TRAP-type C4-dicarboxylate transport system substrate-binding protein
MDIREVYSAMEQKVIDGHENPYNLILASRFFEVQKYVSNTAHFFDFIAVVANKKKFDSLPPDVQKTIRTAMKNAIASQRVAAVKADADALSELQKKGMQYDAMPPPARGDAQGHRRCRRRHQEARRCRTGRPRAGRCEEGLGLLSLPTTVTERPR